jgi:hypothetical protein
MSAQPISERDRLQITELIHRYFWLADQGLADQIPSLFTDDGRLTFGAAAPKPGTLSRAEIGSAMHARAQQKHVTTRHVVSNILLHALDANTISSSALLTLYRSEDSNRDSYPKSIADVEDVFVRNGGDWRISRRTISPIFNRP